MSNVADLIERAANKTGGQAALARYLGVTRQLVTNWKNGHATCVPADRAAIAAFAGEDAVQELVRATLDQTAGTVRGDQLAKVLGKLSRPTGVASAIAVLVLASLICGNSPLYTMYIGSSVDAIYDLLIRVSP